MSRYFPELTNRFAALGKALKGKPACVIGHARPDGDCIGSQLAAAGLLSEMGVEAFAVNADPVPRNLSGLAGSESIGSVDSEALRDVPLIYVDCADEKRVGPKTSELLSEHRRIANIDHHISNTNFAEANLVESSAAATCEILAGIGLDLGLNISPSVAQALYVGIVTDTGRFSYEATSSRVFEICSHLLKRGASPQEAARHLYESETMPRMRLLERFLGSLAFECEGRVCVGTSRQKDFIETGASYADTEGFVDYARILKGVSVGLLFEERKTTTKVSLRANGKRFRVDQIASKFGGGGHACAAALNSELPLSELRQGILAALEERFLDESLDV